MTIENLYRYITLNASDIIYTISLDSKITFHNNAVEKVFETSKEIIEREHYDHLMLPQDKDLAKNLHNDLLQGKKPPIFEHGFTTPKGRLVYLECSVTPIFDKDKNVNGALGIARNVTERRIAQDELKKNKEELEDLVKEKDRLMSVIAHDLRDPFNTLIGYSDIALEQLHNFSQETIKKYFKAINKSSKSAYNLLVNLLSWSNAKSGRIVVNLKPINLGKLFDHIICDLKHSSSCKHILIQKKFDDDIVVNADENMLKTVFRNLIGNAIKFSCENSEIQIEAVEEDSQFTIKIIDQGVGISDIDLAKLFSTEFTISKAGTQNERGTGLGLLICKEFVLKWGGKIWAKSTLDLGSTFTFTIPK